MKRGLLIAAIGLASLVGCASSGQYGHSKIYDELGDEEDAAEEATDYDPVMAKRMPHKWKGKTVSLFGVVVNRSAGSGGAATVKLSVRALEPRNLCETIDTDSCRVTVSDREHATVHALLRLNAEDDIGERSIGPKSLVRVIGKMADEVDREDGEPVIVASYYRHWPRQFYVTTAARSYMRR